MPSDAAAVTPKRARRRVARWKSRTSSAPRQSASAAHETPATSVITGSPPKYDRPSAPPAIAERRRACAGRVGSTVATAASAIGTGTSAASDVKTIGSVCATPEKSTTVAPAAAETGERPSIRSAAKTARRRSAKSARTRPVVPIAGTAHVSGQKTPAFGFAAIARPHDAASIQTGGIPDVTCLAKSVRHGPKK